MAVPTSIAFEILTDIDRWPLWGPSVRSATIDERPLRLGSHGTITTAVGVRLPYVVTSFHADRCWSWSVAGVPATDHVVEPIGDQSCRVTFGAPLAAAPYLAVCAIALRRIEQLCTEAVTRADAEGPQRR